MAKKLLIGFQLETEDHEIPDEFWSFEILTFEFLQDFLLKNPDVLDEYKIVPIFDGDIEEPTMIGLLEDTFE